MKEMMKASLREIKKAGLKKCVATVWLMLSVGMLFGVEHADQFVCDCLLVNFFAALGNYWLRFPGCVQDDDRTSNKVDTVINEQHNYYGDDAE